MRMLMINLDPRSPNAPTTWSPAAAGGQGGPRLAVLRRHRAQPARSEYRRNAAGATCKRSAFSARRRRRAARADSQLNLVGHWSNWNEFHRLERMGRMMYRPNDRRLVIYIGKLESFKGLSRLSAVGEKHFNGSFGGSSSSPAGWAGMGGACRSPRR